MKHAGSIDIHHVTKVLSALANPFVIVGIFSLLVFMRSYMTALSFADLSYVLPATASSYVIMVLLSLSSGCMSTLARSAGLESPSSSSVWG